MRLEPETCNSHTVLLKMLMHYIELYIILHLADILSYSCS